MSTYIYLLKTKDGTSAKVFISLFDIEVDYVGDLGTFGGIDSIGTGQ